MSTTRSFASTIALAVAFGCGGSSRGGDTPATGDTESGPPVAAGEPSAPSADRAPEAKKDLFTRLGGKPAIEAVVGEFVTRLAADPRVKFRFANSDVPELTADLVDFVCVATGGPCKYTGREMRVLHASMHVTEEEWDATVEALVGALDKFKVGRGGEGRVARRDRPAQERHRRPAGRAAGGRRAGADREGEPRL